MTGGNRQTAVSSTADSFLAKYFLSVVAATVAETVTYPLDLTKTRLQIQGEGASSRHGSAAIGRSTGMLGTAVGIVRNEGVLKIFQGLSPALYRHVVYTGCRMSFYEVIRDKILGKNPDGTFPLWKASLGGLVAGAMGQFFASPTDLVKVQMQMEGRRRLEGKPPRVKNTAEAFRKIVQESGFRGLYRGWVPNVQRAALVNMGDLCTYDTVKHQLIIHTNIGDNYYTHTISSFCSGLVAATISTPADVVKTRMMNQPTDNGRGLYYKGSVDCLVQTVNREGFMALYKGFVPIWARMAPWSLTFWLTYEQVRRAAGASTF